MRYISTRGAAPALSFEETMLTGLARDGGLYVPEEWPTLSHDAIRAMTNKPYVDVAFDVMWPFMQGTLNETELKNLLKDTYSAFNHPAVCPLIQLDTNRWVMELHRGATLAFKDVAMQFIGRLFDTVLTRRKQRVCIVGATSGDTGSAAIEAFRDAKAADVFILYPHNKVSDVQRRQMTTPDAPNVHAVAVEGTFDDCQTLVKSMFADFDFRDKINLAAVNSINWARVMAQIVYYFTAAVSLGAPDRKVSFSVPTGNFGDIFAGYVAKKMGLPIDRLMIATNENDILAKTFGQGRYQTTRVIHTISPSMDIQVSSNFERALFDAYDRDGSQIQKMMDELKATGGFSVSSEAQNALNQHYDAMSVSQKETSDTIRDVYENMGYILDPHTAIGVKAASHMAKDTPVVALGCAHAAKFPDAVEKACGVRPDLPKHLSNLFELPEHFSVQPNDLKTIQSYILENKRPTTV
jgi:threonine synthase